MHNAGAPNPNIRVVNLAHNACRCEDVNDGKFFIEGSVRAAGILSFVVVAQLADGTRGSASGKDFFSAMMNLFDQQGTVIMTIEAEWLSGDPKLATNLAVFNAATAAGDPLEVGAIKTPTGKYAVGRSYNKVDVKRLIGSVGNYIDVLVHFNK